MANGTWLLTLSRFFERTSFYLFLATILPFLVSNPVNLSMQDGFFKYSMFLFAAGAGNVIGGVLGDLLEKNRLMLFVGCGLNVAGISLFYVADMDSLYLALGLAGLGSGLYGPNLTALFAKQFNDQPGKADAGFTLLYGAIHLAALIAGFILFALDRDNYLIVFVTCQVLMVFSLVPVLILPDVALTKTSVPWPDLTKGMHIFWVVAAVIIPAFVLMAFSLPSNYLMDQIRTSSDSAAASYEVHDFTGQLVILFSLVLAWYWFVKQVSLPVKLAAGIILAALASFAPLLFNGSAAFYLYVFLAALAEVLIVPSALAMITRAASPRFYSMIFAAVGTVTFVIIRIGPNFTKTNDVITTGPLAFILPGAILLVVGILGFAFSSQLKTAWKKDAGDA
jgi:dipeptide/tripeptide permease